ncbi:MAG TPA: GerMN domain-containing protein [Thermodesulfobacteriota bacterium]|nr:GerMN domain-containing protein [Thermodesulfobacteriota bacterium]
MAQKKGCVPTVLAAAFVTFVILIALFALLGDRFFGAKPGPKKESSKVEPLPIAYKVIDVFFSDETGKALKAEKRRIPKGEPEDELRAAMEELVKGPLSKDKFDPTIPEGAKLISIKIAKDVAYANWSREISSKHQGGSKGELLTIYSIVNTLALNFPEIKKVKLLIDGETEETLAGHILIGIPLGPDKKMIKG